jgi:sulfur carrier protein ThiS
MRLHLSGHLAWYESQKRSQVEVSVPRPTLLIDVLRDLAIPPGEVAITVVNGVAADLQTARVSNSDRVELFPPVGGGK